MGIAVALTTLSYVTSFYTIAPSDAGCVPTETAWINDSHPAPPDRSDKEQLNSTELDKLCPQGEAGPLLIQCKDDKGEFLSGIATNNAGDYKAECTTKKGLICGPEEKTNYTCPDFAIKYVCNCPPRVTETQYIQDMMTATITTIQTASRKDSTISGSTIRMRSNDTIRTSISAPIVTNSKNIATTKVSYDMTRAGSTMRMRRNDITGAKFSISAPIVTNSKKIVNITSTAKFSNNTTRAGSIIRMRKNDTTRGSISASIVTNSKSIFNIAAMAKVNYNTTVVNNTATPTISNVTSATLSYTIAEAKYAKSTGVRVFTCFLHLFSGYLLTTIVTYTSRGYR